MDFPDVPVRLSGGTLGGGGGCLGGGLGAQASVTSFPPTLEPWQVLQLFVVGDFWTCSCHARGALSGGKMSISHGCGGLLRALGHEKLPWIVVGSLSYVLPVTCMHINTLVYVRLCAHLCTVFSPRCPSVTITASVPTLPNWHTLAPRGSKRYFPASSRA